MKNINVRHKVSVKNMNDYSIIYSMYTEYCSVLWNNIHLYIYIYIYIYYILYIIYNIYTL